MKINQPTPNQIVQRRKLAGLTQSKTADLLHVDIRTVQKWLSGERRMHSAFWELFLIKTEPLIKAVNKY